MIGILDLKKCCFASGCSETKNLTVIGPRTYACPSHKARGEQLAKEGYFKGSEAEIAGHTTALQPDIAISRITREELLIEWTKLAAKRGTCLRAQVGCIIALDGRPLSTGYNGSPPGEPHCLDVGCQMEEGHCIRTTHAEANAIAWAARKGIAIEGATLYVYGWAAGICHRCRKLALSAGIAKTVEIPLEVTDEE